MTKLNGSIAYLGMAGIYLKSAADRLEAQDSYHLEHARAQVELAIKAAELVIRQIDREQAARAERLTEEAARDLRRLLLRPR